MAQAKTRGDQLDVLDISSEISANTTAITTIASGLTTDVGAIGVLNQDFILNKILIQVNANTVVDVFIYDTTLDDDGGQWVNEASSQSWYHEELNTTTRGATRAFPKLAVIVAEAGKITIYDGNDANLPMWLVFNLVGWNGGHIYSASTASAVTMLNGELSVATYSGFSICRFLDDETQVFTSAAGWGGFSLTSISERNTSSNYSLGTDTTIPVIVHTTCNDVAITSDGHMNNIVYVATDGGLSRIAVDGSVSSWTDLGNTVNVVNNVDVDDNYLFFSVDTGPSQKRQLMYPVNLELVDARYSDSLYYRFATDSNVVWSVNSINMSHGGVPGLVADYISKALGSDRAVNLLYPNYDNGGSAMNCTITDSWNSGVQHGDIKGAWLVSTDDTDLINSEVGPDRSVNNNGLIVTGTITKTPVAAGAELVAYDSFGTTNYLEQAYNVDLDFGTGDFYVMCWVITPAASYKPILNRASDPAGSAILFDMGLDNTPRLVLNGASINSNIICPEGTLNLVAFKREDGIVYANTNGKPAGSNTSAVNVSNALAILRVGNRVDDAIAFTGGSIALLRMGKGAPTDAQFKEIYEAERPLFNENSKCTLQHGSSDVKALDYDESTGILTVCDAVGITKFNGLIVESSEVEVATSVSTVSDKQVTGV